MTMRINERLTFLITKNATSPIVTLAYHQEENGKLVNGGICL